MKHKAHAIISVASDTGLADALLDTYRNLEKHYYLKSWKTSELDAGHFVEAARRFIEKKLTGSYTPIGTSLSNFNETVLRYYESQPGHESYRILIPRTLFAAYTVRNKRGVGHLGLVSPSHTDATLILSSCKWALAEIVRLESNLTLDQTASLVDSIVERTTEHIWEHGGIKRVLADGLTIPHQVLILLFDSSPQSSGSLKVSVECRTEKYFSRVLRGLHSDRLIELSADSQCVLTPKGRAKAEQILLKLKPN